MSKTGLFFQSCRHVLNWEGRTLVWSEEKIFEHAQVRTAARLQQQLSLLCTATQYSTQLLVTTETD